MCPESDDQPVKVSDEDLARVRELRMIASGALAEASVILAKYMGIDPDSVDSATVNFKRKAGVEFGDGVPPVYEDPCVQFNSTGVCAYYERDPPGETRPCPPVTLPA